MNKRSTPELWRRREFLGAGAQTVATATLIGGIATRAQALSKWTSAARITGAEDITHSADQNQMEKMVLHAIDVARAAGARYAEATVTRTVVQYISESFGSDSERFTIGVRALFGGAWGFASSTYWQIDEAAALAKDAVSQARINSAVFPRQIDIGSYPVAKGSWTTPVRIDPFKISIEEKRDFFKSLRGGLPRYIPNRKYGLVMDRARLSRQERTTASSEGALFSQTLYTAGQGIHMTVEAQDPLKGKQNVKVGVRGIGEAAEGWERFLDARIRDQFPELAEEAEKMLFLPTKPVDVGRYEVVMAAGSVGSLVRQTLGDATQLDRAVGMEANAGGTSYLGPNPEDHLGTSLGSPMLTLTANRSLPKGLATVKWDDEGVEPDTFTIIQDGTFVDYQTTREQASWLSEWYQTRQQPIRSHGCAKAPEALNFPLQHTPNLKISPSNETATLDEMVKNTKKGIAFLGALNISTDFQSRSGGSQGALMREIVDGKLGPVLIGADILFTSAELWKSIMEIGGQSSVEVVPSGSGKGQPSQSSWYSIETVPVRFKDMTVIDGSRR